MNFLIFTLLLVNSFNNKLLLHSDVKNTFFEDNKHYWVNIQWPLYLDKEDKTNQFRMFGKRHGTLYDFEKRKECYKEAIKALLSLPMDDEVSYRLIASNLIKDLQQVSEAGDYIKDIWDLTTNVAKNVNKKYVKVESVSDVLKNKIKHLARQLNQLNNKQYHNLKMLSLAISDLQATSTLIEPFIAAAYWQALSTDWARIQLEKMKELNITDPAFKEAIEEMDIELTLGDSYWRSLVLELHRHREEFLEQAVSLGMVLTSIMNLKLLPLKILWEEAKWISEQEDYAREASLLANIAKYANADYVQSGDEAYKILALRAQVGFYNVSYKIFSAGIIGYVFSKLNIKNYGNWADYLNARRALAIKYYQKTVSPNELIVQKVKDVKIYENPTWRGGDGSAGFIFFWDIDGNQTTDKIEICFKYQWDDPCPLGDYVWIKLNGKTVKKIHRLESDCVSPAEGWFFSFKDNEGEIAGFIFGLHSESGIFVTEHYYLTYFNIKKINGIVKNSIWSLYMEEIIFI